ncbi:thioredoxin family protein [Aquimarina sp. 2201CG1-2-11]|uniref:thioredoxin family protein n=1 Tax=Aquimarina discodermiae TaxID=3231043 RepID=UPI0034631DA0
MKYTTENITLMRLIEEGIADSYTYEEYRSLVSDLLSEDKSTGHTQTEALTNYSMLNDRRMKRLDKTIKIDEEIKEAVANKSLNVGLLVLSEGWCGDAAQSLPIINKIAALNEGIDLKIVLRDDHDDLMSNFLTNGGKSIPKLIMYDRNTKEVIDTWGPRPSIATQMVNDYKEEHGQLDAKFKQDLQVWYNADKGKNIADDIAKLLQ